VLEAMACGLPVVLGAGCHFPEAVDAGAAVSAPSDSSGLAAVLGRLVRSPGRRDVGRRGRELVRQRYAWAGIVARLDAVYRRPPWLAVPGAC
jgi:poly(glycerol-phosphate) alpha-glucosyltransferase